MGRECRASLASLWMVQVNSYYYSLQVHAEPAADRAPGVTWEEALQFSLRTRSFSSKRGVRGTAQQTLAGWLLRGQEAPWDASGAGAPGHAKIGAWSPSSASALTRVLLGPCRALSSWPSCATWL